VTLLVARSSGNALRALGDSLRSFFRAQSANRFARLPHFGVADGIEFFCKLLLVVRDDRKPKAPGCIPCRSSRAVVQFLEHGQNRLLELRLPVQRTALGRGGAVGIHPVHAVLVHEADEALGQLLDGLVEGFAGAVAVLAQARRTALPSRPPERP
jgi:hypothetical protein